MTNRIRVAILEDQQSTLDAYLARLSSAPQIDVVGTAPNWSAFEALLAAQPVEVALLDLNVPAAPTNINNYPFFHAIPQVLRTYPQLDVLVISMLTDHALIEAVLAIGVSGYLLKNDANMLNGLAAVITSVASGGIVISQNAYRPTVRRHPATVSAPQLTARQREALSLSAAYPEASLAQLAEQLGVMNSTARNLLSGAYVRLGVRNRAAAVARAQQLGLINAGAPAARRPEPSAQPEQAGAPAT